MHIRFILFLLISQFWVSAALAQSDLVSINRLSFECENCRRLSGNSCEIEVKGTVKSVDCSSILPTLLEKELSKKEVSKYPVVAELASFLLFESPSTEVVEPALGLLLRKPAGRPLFLSSFEQLYNKYPKALERALLPHLKEKEFAHQVWSKHSILSGSLRAEIVQLSDSYEPRNFFETLSEVDLKSDIKALRSALEVGQKLDRDFQMEISRAVHFIYSCREFPNCSIEKLKSPNLLDYARRVKTNLVVSKLSSSNIEAEQALDSLSKLDYQNYRTPSMHKTLYGVLSSVVQKSKGGVLNLKDLKKEHAELITYFSTKDSNIARLLGLTSRRDSRARLWNIVGLLLKGLLILLFIFCSYYLWAVRQQRISEEELDLRDLETYFGLPRDASLEDLSNKHRTLARRLHPDSGGGDGVAFSEMTERYQKAKKLIGQR